MSAAIGIHDHPFRKLGKRPPVDKPAIRFGAHLKVAPPAPIVDEIPVLSFPMDRNDVAGDCVVAGLDHALQIIDALLGVQRANWTDKQILGYYQTQNPGFKSWADCGGPNDQGMDIQTFLEYLVAQGVILGFAKVDPTSETEMKAAMWLGLAIVLGADMQVAQQSQSVWDYVPHSGDWGGHCFTDAGYSGTPDDDEGVSWGAVYKMTQPFVAHQVSEAWFIITQAHVDHPGFRAGFDLASFAAAYQEITGAPFPVNVPPDPPTPTPVPPAPAPTPSPGPSPTPVPPTPTPSPPSPVDEDSILWADVRDWTLSHRHHGEARTVAHALAAWADYKGFS